MEMLPTPTSDKVRKKLAKCIVQLRRHDPDVIVSESATNVLYVGNSGVLCGVQWDELEAVFEPFGPVDFCVFPTGRPYSFATFETVEKATEAFASLHGKHPSQVAKNDVVFYLAFVKNVPISVASVNTERPPDLRVIEDFIDENEQQQLLDVLATCSNDGCEGTLKNRQVFHFGFEFIYGSNTVNLDGPYPPPFPPICQQLVDRMCQEQLVKYRPDQLTVNIYEPGYGIPWHVDTHSAFEDEIISLSLLSDVVMNFRPLSDVARCVPVKLPARSLAIMKGASRYVWEHCIASRKYDCDPASSRLMKRSRRVSFTFRAVKRKPCECGFPQFCDWNRGGAHAKLPSSDTEARDLEKSFVANVYQEIAAHFDETRYSQWREVKSFLDNLPTGSVLLDVGCGNGKYLNEDCRLLKLGCDLSANLCSIASVKGACVVNADGLHLPFRDGSFDAVISVAVIHHMSTVDRRLLAICEMLRVLRVGGRALITVWAFEQKMNNEQSEYLKWGRNRESTDPTGDSGTGSGALLVHLNNTAFQQQDLLVPWHRKRQPDDSMASSESDRFLRFYHVFKQGELENLCTQIHHCRIINTTYEQGNWMIAIERII